MKRIICHVLLISLVFQCALCFSSCSEFLANISKFTENGNFYEKVFDTIGSVFGGNDTFFPLKSTDKGSAIDITATLENYKIKGKAIEDGKGEAKLSLTLFENSDMFANVYLDAFSQKSELTYTNVNDDMLIKFDNTDKPYYFKGEGANLVSTAIGYYLTELENAQFVTGKEAYKLHGNNFDTDTVEFCFNSDVTAKIANQITTLFINTPNLALNNMYYRIQEIVYKIQEEKLHLTWRRYFERNVLCRESYKIHDNFNHYYVLDIAYSELERHSNVEISLTANNGDLNVIVFTLSVSKEDTEENEFTTTAKFIMGDELYINADNRGTALETKGNAEIHFISELGEVKLPVNYSYSRKDTDIIFQSIKVETDNVYISFNLNLGIKYKTTTEKIKLDQPDTDYLNLSDLTDIFTYSYKSQPLFKSAYKNTWLLLQGKDAEAPPVTPEDEEEPYTIDISFDSGTEIDTNGEIGLYYVNLLTSDNYVLKYHSFEDKDGSKKTQCTEYRKDGNSLYKYLYYNGDKYERLLKDTTEYEVHYDVEKIIFSEYDAKTFVEEFPKPNYQYYQSGKCVYQDRQLFYERYFDKKSNYYTFIFNENSELEIISLYSKNSDNTLLMFIDEINNVVPEDAFELPDFEYISVQDYFD